MCYTTLNYIILLYILCCTEMHCSVLQHALCVREQQILDSTVILNYFVSYSVYYVELYTVLYWHRGRAALRYNCLVLQNVHYIREQQIIDSTMVLCCTVLCYVVLYNAAMNNISYIPLWYCVVLYCVELCSVLNHTILYCSTPSLSGNNRS